MKGHVKGHRTLVVVMFVVLIIVIGLIYRSVGHEGIWYVTHDPKAIDNFGKSPALAPATTSSEPASSVDHKASVKE